MPRSGSGNANRSSSPAFERRCRYVQQTAASTRHFSSGWRIQEINHRAQIKQLKNGLQSREANIATSRSQLEEEPLIIDPGVAYDETRSHRLDVHNEGSPRSKAPYGFVGQCTWVLASMLTTRDPQLSPEASSPADGFDLPLPADENWPSKNLTPPLELQAQLRTGQSHQAALPESDLRQPPPPSAPGIWIGL